MTSNLLCYRRKLIQLVLAGDHLDLYAVLELFKKAESLEKFEEMLNKEDNQVNNLDLNGDDEIDYIRVINRIDSNFHAITLQVPMSENESQDLAVITIEKKDDKTAYLQIIGDEDLYGKDYIIEPYDEKGDKELQVSPIVVFVNVWGWPIIKPLYAPGYKLWISPWRWNHYPGWWKPWKPLRWRVYHPRVVIHHRYYHRTTVVLHPRAHSVYHAHRRSSTNIHHHRSANANNTNRNSTNRKGESKKLNKQKNVKKASGNRKQNKR
jgi:hypothetical protein